MHTGHRPPARQREEKRAPETGQLAEDGWTRCRGAAADPPAKEAGTTDDGAGNPCNGCPYAVPSMIWDERTTEGIRGAWIFYTPG